MTIQDTLLAFLAAHGEPLSVLCRAETATTQPELAALVDRAIRTARESERTHVAHVLYLALDDPANGGPGLAQDFAVVAEEHPLNDGEIWYRGYRCPQGVGPGKPYFDTGLYWRDPEQVKRRIVGLYRACRTIAMPEGTNAA